MPDNEKETRLRITGDPSNLENAYTRASAAGRKFQVETVGITDAMKTGWLQVTAALAATAGARELMVEGAKAMQSEDAFRNTAASFKVNADEMIAKMKELTNHTVDDSDMMQRAMKMMTGGIAAGDVERIAEMSRLAARRTGEDVGTALSNIGDAIETGRAKALRAYGLLTKDQQEVVDKARAEGIEVNMTSMAWENYQRHIAAMGPAQENAVERMQQMKTALKDIGEEAGKVLITLTGKWAGTGATMWSNIIGSGPLGGDRDNTSYLQRLMLPQFITDWSSKAQNWLQSKAKKFSPEPEAGELWDQLDKDAEARQAAAKQTSQASSYESTLKSAASFLEKQKDLSSIIGKSGTDALKMSLDDLNRSIVQDTNDLKTLTLTYQNLTDIAKEGMKLDRDLAQLDKVKAAYASYGDAITKVYDAENSAQNAVLDVLRTINLKEEERAKRTAQITSEITQTEIKANEARLTNARSLYDKLKDMQKGFYDAMVKSTQEIAKLEKDMVANRRSVWNTLNDVYDKANPARNEQEEYERRMIRYEEQMAFAATQTGDARVAALKEGVRMASEFKDTITMTETERRLVTTGQGFQTSTEFQDVASTRVIDMLPMKMRLIAAAGQAIDETYRQMATDAQANFAAAAEGFVKTAEDIKTVEERIRALETSMIAFDGMLAQQRVLTINAEPALAELHKVLALQERVNSTLFPASQAPAAPEGGSNWDNSAQVIYLDEYARGTNYVPKTGPYLLHQGEAVVPAERNSGGGGVTVGTININLPDSIRVDDPREFARSLAPHIDEAITRYRSDTGRPRR